MWLLGVVLGVAVGLRGARHGGRLLDVVGVDGLHASGGLVRRHDCGRVEDEVEEEKRKMWFGWAKELGAQKVASSGRPSVV